MAETDNAARPLFIGPTRKSGFKTHPPDPIDFRFIDIDNERVPQRRTAISRYQAAPTLSFKGPS
jgi:hypothetical protein